MGARILLTVLGITLLAGCAAQEIQTALPADHPANSQAAVASVPTRSITLRPEPVNVEAARNASAPVMRHDHVTTEQGASNAAHDRDGDGAAEPGTADRHSEQAANGEADHEQSTRPVGAAAALYVCPMHKDITSDKPAKCPKCKMKLKAKKALDTAPASASRSSRDAAAVEPSSVGAGDAVSHEHANPDKGHAEHQGHQEHQGHEGHDADGGDK